jgi:hypothetical protein
MNVTPDPPSHDLVPLSSSELGQLKAVLRAPPLGSGWDPLVGSVAATDERILVSPYPLRETFKAAAAALRVRLYHGATEASPPFEDLPSGTIRGRRALFEGSPSAVRLLLGVPLVGQIVSSWIIDVEIRVADRRDQVLIALRIRTTLPQRIGEGAIAKEFDGLVADFLRLAPTEQVQADPIIGPNEIVPEAFTGSLRDYSRCATLDDVDALRTGDFPLGRYLWPTDPAHGTIPLFLGAPRSAGGSAGEHLLFRNVCVTAPVGAGKLFSILRPWAVAAAAASYSTFVFDPRGDLALDLRQPLLAAGSDVVVFSTRPEQESANWNFLDEVEIEADGRLKNRRSVESILDALLPISVDESRRSETNEFAALLHRGWLGGFVQIARYALGDEADASTLYGMARDEHRLRELLEQVRERWPHDVYERLYYEVIDLFDKFEWGYTAQLRGVANALAPFNHEPLRTRTRAMPGKRNFRIADLFDRPTSFIAAGSLADLDVARRLGSLASSLLLSYVYERRPPAPGQPDTRIPIVLLLNETQLLSTDLTEFLAVGRGFKAGVVTFYHDLDDIRDEAIRREILTNCNTFIALRGIGAGSRRSLMERFPRSQISVSGAAASLAEDTRRQMTSGGSGVEVPVLGDYEIRAMPGPRHVAVVHIQDGTVAGAKPFLVDLTDNGQSSQSEPQTRSSPR